MTWDQSKVLRKDNTTGIRGVKPISTRPMPKLRPGRKRTTKNKYRVELYFHGRPKHFGCYETLEEATIARDCSVDFIKEFS